LSIDAECYRSVVSLSVTFVHCAQTAEGIEMILFAYYSPVFPPDRFKIWLLTRSTPSSKNTTERDPPHVALSVGEILLQIAAEWLEIAQWSQYKATTIALSSYLGLYPFHIPPRISGWSLSP